MDDHDQTAAMTIKPKHLKAANKPWAPPESEYLLVLAAVRWVEGQQHPALTPTGLKGPQGIHQAEGTDQGVQGATCQVCHVTTCRQRQQQHP